MSQKVQLLFPCQFHSYLHFMKNYIIIALVLTLIISLGMLVFYEKGGSMRDVSISDVSVDFPISQLSLDELSDTNIKLREEFTECDVYCVFSGGLKIVIISKNLTELSDDLIKSISSKAIFYLSNPKS